MSADNQRQKAYGQAAQTPRNLPGRNGLFRYDCNSKRNGYSCYERKNDDGYFYIKENDNLIFETENSIYEFIERMQVSSNQSLEQSASVSSNYQNQNNFSNNVPYVTSNKNKND